MSDITDFLFTSDSDGLPTNERIVTTAANLDLLHKAGNIGYKLPIPSGLLPTVISMPQTVEGKLRETVSIFDFGAKNGNASDAAANSTAIVAANEYCNSTGSTLLLGDFNNTMYFNSSINLSGHYSVISRGTLSHFVGGNRSNDIFITVGEIGNTKLSGYFEFSRITCYQGGEDPRELDNYTAIRFLNLNKSSIVFNGEGIFKFNTGIRFEGASNGFAFNRVQLPICWECKTSVQLKSSGTDGFCNSNIFIGGGAYAVDNGYGIDMINSGGGGINCNAFYGFNFEMGTNNNLPVKASGSVSDNVFRDFRNESVYNSTRTFFKSTDEKVRRNYFYSLFDDPANLSLVNRIDAASGTFNIYRSQYNQVLECFKGQFELTSFTPSVTGTKKNIPGLNAYKRVTSNSQEVIVQVDGFTTSEAIITEGGFSLNSNTCFFGRKVKLNHNPYLLIQCQFQNTSFTKYVYLIPYKNDSIVTHAYDPNSGGKISDTFIKRLGNGITDIYSLNNTIIYVDGNYESDFLLWFNIFGINSVDEVLILFSQGSTNAGSFPATWTKIGFAVGNNNEKNITQEVANTSNDIICTLNSGGYLTLPARKVGKGFLFTGTPNDTFSVGTTSAGTDIVDHFTFESDGKLILSGLYFYLLDQIFYISGNSYPVIVILPV